MPTVKLTDLIISSSKPKEKIYALNDIEIPGLQCVINPSGKKTFRLKTRDFAKKIGIFPVVKYAEAKKIALVWYGELLQGEKPELKKKTEPLLKKTVDALIEEYLDFKKGSWTEQTIYKYNWVWQKIISPQFGNKDVMEITDALINQFLFSLKNTYTNAVFSANILRPAFKHGKKLGYPVPRLEYDEWHKYKDRKRERYITVAELPIFWKTLEKIERSSLKKWGMGDVMCQLIKLLLLTGCRRGEILNLKWSQVYLEEGYLQLWKTKNKKGRMIPILAEHREIFKKIPRFVSSPYIFSALSNQQKPLSTTTLFTFWANFMKDTKLNENPDIEPLVIHSLRHTYISAANKARISPWTLQALVGHMTSNSVTGDYIHVDLEELTQAAEVVVQKLLQGTAFFHSCF